MQVHFISIKINQLIHLKSYFVNIYVWCITAKVHGLLMLSNALNHVKSLNNNNLYLYCKVLPFKRNNPISMRERLNHNPFLKIHLTALFCICESFCTHRLLTK